MDPLVTKYFPAEKTVDEQVSQALSYGVRQNPDQYAKDQQAGLTGVSDARARDAAEFNSRLQKLGISTLTPVTKNIYSDPDTAAMAWDDLRGVQAMETLSNQFHYDGLTPSQTQAVMLDRARVQTTNARTSEYENIKAQAMGSLVGPVLHVGAHALGIVGAALEAGAEATDIGKSAHDAQGVARAKEIFSDYKTSRFYKAVTGEAQNLIDIETRGMKAAPSEVLVDPYTKQAFKNPDYSMWGRGFVNQAEGLPGMLGSFAVNGYGKFAEFAMGAEAAKRSYERSKQEQHNNDALALVKAWGIGALNYALFRGGGEPGSTARTLPTEAALDAASSTVTKAITEPLFAGVKRGFGMAAGMTAGEELIQNVDSLGDYWTKTDPIETLKKFASSAANFSMFEFAHAITPAIANVQYMRAMREQAEGLKLRERNLDKFRSIAEQTTDGVEVMIPKDDLVKFCQESGIKVPEVLGSRALNIQDQFNKAGDSELLRIKFSDYLAYTTGKSNELSDRLDPRVKFNESDASPAQVQEFMKARFLAEQRWAIRMGVGTEVPAEPSESYHKLKSMMKDQLIKIFNEQTADTYATWHAATLENLGLRFNVDPMTLQEKYGFFVERVGDEAKRRNGNGGGAGSYAQEVRGGSQLRENGSRIGSDASIQRLLEGYAAEDSTAPAGAVPGTVEGSDPLHEAAYYGEGTGNKITAATYDGDHVMVTAHAPGMPYVTGTVQGNLFVAGSMHGENNKGVGYDLYQTLGQYLQGNHPDVTHYVGLAGGTPENPEGIVRLRNSFNDTQWSGDNVTNRWAATPVASLAEGPVWRDHDPREVQRRNANRRVLEEEGGLTSTTVARSSWSFERGSGRDGGSLRIRDIAGVPVIESWHLDPEHAQLLARVGIAAPEVHELDYRDPLAAGVFREAIAATKDNNKYAASVHVYDENEYAGMRMFLTEDRHAGFALKPDGDIISVFSHQNPEVKGAVHVMLEIAKKSGGSKLDCFDTVLPSIYSDHGFAVASRMEWNESYAPEGWDHETFSKFNDGRPDVVFMALDNSQPIYDKTQGTKTLDYDEALQLQRRAQILGGAEVIGTDSGEVFGQPLSTRVPTGKNPMEDYQKELLITDLSAAKLDPKSFEKNIKLLSQYVNFPADPKASPERRAEQIIEHMKGNLLWLFSKMDPAVREHAKLWYVGAEDIATKWGEHYGLTKEQVAGVLATQSPQKDWFQNVSLAQRILDIVTTKQDFAWTEAMSENARERFKPEQLALAEGKTLRECKTNAEKAVWVRAYDEVHNPSDYRMVHPDGSLGDFIRKSDGNRTKVAWGGFDTIEKALNIVDSGVKSNISKNLGKEHKVRNFYNNIYDPSSSKFVTIDTHAVAAALMRGLGGSTTEVRHNLGGGSSAANTGTSGTYPIIAEAYFRAAAEAGVLPRELQSITWEAVRSMMPDTFKRAQTRNMDLLEKSFENVASGKINKSTKKPFTYKDVAENVTNMSSDPEAAKLAKKIARLKEPTKEDIAALVGKLTPYLEGSVDRAWRDYSEGRARLDETRDKIMKIAQDYRKDQQELGTPSWVGYQDQQNGTDGSTYYQPKPEGTRGDITFGPDNKLSIRMFREADLSTLVHELSHAYFKVYRDLIKSPDAPVAEKERYGKLLDWLGVQPGQELTREHIEKLARAEEQWLHTGKAPSADLAPAFMRMSLWMRQVYGNVAAYQGIIDKDGNPLKVGINPDVADFFNRLHASDEAITKMKDFEPMFTTAADMGVPQKVFDAYVKLAGKATDNARQELTQKLLKQGERRQKSWWKSEEAKAREEVTTKVDSLPIMRVMKALKDGEVEMPEGGKLEVTFSRPALIERYGEDFVKNLSAKIQRHISNVGADPDVIAEMFGYPSGEALLQDVAAAPKRNELIDKATAEEMSNRHGDMMLDGTMVDEAMKVLHGEDRSVLIHQELAILEAQRRKAKTLEAEMLRQQAANLKDVRTLAKEQARNKEQEQRNIERVKAKVDQEEVKEALDSLPKLVDVRAKAVADVNSMTLRELRPNQFLSAARRASKKSMERAMRNDYEGAVAAQQEYLLNHFRYVEAADRRDNIASQVNELRNLQDTQHQQNLGKAGGTFLEQVNSLLERVGLKTISRQQIERNQTLAQWADEMLRQGQQPFVDPKLLDEARKVNYADMTLGDFQNLYDTVRSIAHVANQELTAIIGDKRAKFDEAVQEAVSTEAPRKFPDAAHSGGEDTTGGLTHFLRSYDAMAVKMAVMVDKLDGGDVNGIWRRAMLDPIRNATNEWHKMTEEFVARMHERMQMPKEMRKSLTDKLTLPSGEVINRNQLIAMVLNCGNADNRAMLENKEVGNFDKADVEFAVRQIRPQEAEFIQGVWDVVETLKPRIGELEKRLNGIEPKWVESAPIVMGGKEYRGGYYPLVADHVTQTGRRQAPTPDQLFDDGYSGVGTVHGFTKDRTGRQYKMDLNWNNIVTSHLNSVVKDLAFREAVISVNKFISNDSIRQTVRECLGKEYEAQLTPWLRSIVNDQSSSRLQGTNAVDTFVNKSRGHAVNMMIAFKAASTIVQVADMTRVLPMVNTFHLARGFAEYAAHPFEAHDFIARNSKLMEHRQENLDRDIREKMSRMMGDDSAKAAMLRWGYKGFGLIDRQISSIAWLGAYKESMAKSSDHDTACREADRVVEMSLQSGEAMDLVALQRNHSITKMFTMFAGDSIAAYNLCRTLGQNVKSPADAMRFALGFVLSTAVANIIADYITGRKPPEDTDNKAEWYAWQAALSPFRMLPIVKDAMSAWQARALGGGGIDYRWSPMLSAAEKTADGLYAQKKFFLDDEEDFDQWLKDSATAAGYLYGVPGGAQMINTTSYLHGVATGDITPEDPLNFAAGATIGGRK